MEEVRYGIIGVGGIGSQYARLFADHIIEGAVLAAVSTSRPEELDELKEAVPGLEVYDDPEKMMAQAGIDAVVICTPHYLHPELAIAGFDHGLHVLVERPAGAYTGQVREMNERASRSDRCFGIMYAQRSDHLFQKLRELVRNGELGDIHRTSWTLTSSYRAQGYYHGWRGTWGGGGGGILMNAYIHQIDIWQWILGMMPERLRATCRYGKLRDIEVENEAVIYADFPGGITGVMIASAYEAPGTDRLEITGDNGHAIIENGRLTFYKLNVPASTFSKVGRGFEKPASKPVVFEAKDIDSQISVVLQNFTDAIRYGSDLLAPGQDGIKALEIINAAYLSDWQDNWVSLPIDDALYHDQLSRRIEEAKLKKEAEKATV